MDIQNNQTSFSNVPSPPAVPVSPVHKKKILWLAVVFVCIVAILVGIFYFPRSKPSPVVEKNTPAALSQTTIDYYTNYAKVLASSLGVSVSDPFSLNADAKQKIRAAKDVISNSPNVVIIDGTVYPSLLSLLVQGDSYRFKPSTGSDVKDFEVIKKENITVDELIKNRDELEKGVIKIIYPYIRKSPSLSDADIYKLAKKEINAHLDSQISANKLVKYEYDEVDGNMRLTYSSMDIPFKFNPVFLAEQIYFVIDAYSNPETYSKDVLEGYNKRMSGGEILIVNNNQGTPEMKFVDRNTTISDISILVDDSLSATQKISELSDGANIISSYKEYEDIKSKEAEPKPVSFLSPETAFAQSSPSGADDLMNRDGAIAPPYKDIAYFMGPDPNVYFEDSRLQHRDPAEEYIRDIQNGYFAPFFKNFFSIFAFSGGSSWGKKNVEDIVSILKDERISIFYWSVHGGEDAGVLAELYDLGPLSSDDISRASTSTRNGYLQKRSQFDNRISDLKKKYGQDAISDDIESSELEPGLRSFYTREPSSLAPSLKGVLELSGDMKLGAVIIKPSLVKTQSKDSQKSVVVFNSCFGGLFAGYFNTRVLLTVDAKKLANGLTFSTDLKKISNYLLKNTDKINNSKVNTDNARNYNILTDLKQDQFTSIPTECIESQDSLCNIKLYSNNPDQTVAVSPHVKLADADRVDFSVPMETTSPGKIVTIDASQCKTSQGILSDLEPKWDSSDKNADMSITLPWIDKVYREWKASDFDDGDNPIVRYAKITVHRDVAVSKVSKIDLTGNTDCFDGTAKHPECWQKPDTLIYNGNHPNTDFTYAMPCIDEMYYRGCKDRNKVVKISQDSLKRGDNNFPQNMMISGECYSEFYPSDQDKVGVKQTTSWDNGSSCTGLCGTPSAGGDCLNPLILKLLPSSQGGNELVDMSGKVIFKDQSSDGKTCKPGVSIQDFASFGSHVAYALQYAYPEYALLGPYSSEVCPKRSYTAIIYDGKEIYRETVGGRQPGEFYQPRSAIISNLQLFGDNIFYRKNDSVSENYYFNLKIMPSGNCALSTNSVLCFDDARNLILNSNKIGSSRSPFFNSYLNPGTFLFDKTVAWLDNNQNVKLRLPDGVIKDKGLGNYLYLFGNHLVIEREPKIGYSSTDVVNGFSAINNGHIIYDDKDLGPGDSVFLFGDQIVYTKLKQSGGGNGGLAPYINVNGVDFDVLKKLNIEKYKGDLRLGGFPIHATELDMFDNHLTFSLALPNSDLNIKVLSTHTFYDWKDIGTVSNLIMFGDHLVYIKDGHIIYDGKDLGLGSSPSLFEDHIGFKTNDHQYYFDGQIYWEGNNMDANLGACYRYYLENNVPTSPYGSIKY